MTFASEKLAAVFSRKYQKDMQLARARMRVLNSSFHEGSNNIKKPMKINAAYKRKAGIRNDFLHQTSKLQVKKRDLIVN